MNEPREGPRRKDCGRFVSLKINETIVIGDIRIKRVSEHRFRISQLPKSEQPAHQS